MDSLPIAAQTLQKFAVIFGILMPRPPYTTLADAWAAYSAAFGEAPHRLLELARAMKKVGRLDDANLVLDHAFKLHPDNIDVLLLRAETAVNLKLWNNAADLYARAREISPENQEANIYGGWTLWEAGRYAESDLVLENASKLFPENPWGFIHYAMSAQSRKDWEDAAQRYTKVRLNFPDQASGFIEGGWTLREAGRAEEADSVLAEAIARFPGERMAWFHYGRNASALAQWRESVRRREIAQSLFPGEPEFERELNQARYELQFAHAGDGDDLNVEDRTATRAVVETASELMMQFASIGDNCEFGLTQRHFGAEPLGLLRFGEIPNLEFLLNALNSQFEGVGEPENTSSEIISDEVVIFSTRGFTMMHSHVYLSSGATQEGTVAQMLPRLKYLRRRLIEELIGGTKIFVFKRFEPLSDDEVRRLHAALEVYGPNTLLCVRRPQESCNEGEVLKLDARIAIGYIDFPKIQTAGKAANFDAWLEVCRKTKELFSAEK